MDLWTHVLSLQSEERKQFEMQRQVHRKRLCGLECEYFDEKMHFLRQRMYKNQAEIRKNLPKKNYSIKDSLDYDYELLINNFYVCTPEMCLICNKWSGIPQPEC